MNIVLCADENYAMPCGICITSVLENNKESQCRIYILTDGFSDKTILSFKELQLKYGQEFIINKIDSTVFEGLKVSDRFRRSIYFRFLIPDIVDGDKALYLDSDIIVNGDLKSLWDTDLSSWACAVVEDQCSDDIRLHNRIEMYSTYFNSGVLLMNLKYWRDNGIKEKLVDYIFNNPEKCLYPDQDALNVILEGKIFFLDYKYNFQSLMWVNKDELLLHKDKWNNIQMAFENPIIIHYTAGLKPWFLEYDGMFKDYFLRYKILSPWITYKLLRKISLRYHYILVLKRILKKYVFFIN